MTTQRLVCFVVRAGWAACLTAIAAAIAFPEVAREAVVQWSPWLLGLAVLGIPHGALDHRVGIELGSTASSRPAPGVDRIMGGRWGFHVAYLMAAAAVLALWFVSPIAASIGFLVVAAFHFGQGDVYWSGRFGLAARTGSAGYRASLLLSRSSLPIALPLLAFPGVLSGAASTLAVRLFGREGWSISPAAIDAGLVALGGVVAVQVAWALVLGWRGDETTRRAAALDIAETALLTATFAIVPPILALGVYFNAWHSLRHIARLLLISGPTRSLVNSGRLASAFGAFQKSALPMTCGALALVAGLGLVVGRRLVTVPDLGFIAVVGLSALTLPHVLVVAWMDARQGVWSRPGPGPVTPSC